MYRHEPQLGVVERDVTLRKGVVHLVVDYDGDEAWASYVSERAAAYLEAAESYLDVAFDDAAAVMFHDLPKPWTIRIVGREEVMLGKVHIGAYNNTYGVFGPDRGIFMEYRLAKPGDPALVMHELTHDWFHGTGSLAPGAPRNDSSPAWFVEGIASMTPITIVESGALPLDAAEQRAMRRHWGQWAVPRPADDVAIVHDPRPDGGIGIFYGKSYRVQLIIEHLLGPERYRKLLQNTFHHPPRTNDDALALLREAAPDVDWNDVLRGWIFPGPYGRFKPDDVPRLQSE
jgi:hypothetical protein